MIEALIVLSLIFLNGVFVAAEFAILAAPRASIKKRAAKGERIASAVLHIMEDPKLQDQYIATAQLGITLASLGLGMYGEHALAAWIAGHFGLIEFSGWVTSHVLASIISIGLLTYMHIVLGEMIPKSLAIQKSEKTLLAVSSLMIWMKKAMFPLVLGLNNLGNIILRFIGVRRDVSDSRYYTPEELEIIVKESEKGGLINKEAGKVLKDLLKFNDITAAEAMIPRVHVSGIQINTPYNELAGLFQESSHTRYPVYDQDMDKIVGIVHIKDILGILINKKTLTNENIRPVTFVPETTMLGSALGIMSRERTQMVVVMDEHGGTAGILTIEDLFEEVIGEIEEEENGIIDGSLHSSEIRASGLERVEELGERLGLALSHPDVDTVSGLILMLLERPPLIGDRVVFEGIEFEVTSVEGNGVDECIIRYC